MLDYFKIIFIPPAQFLGSAAGSKYRESPMYNALLRKTLNKWKNKIIKQETNAKDNNVDEISDNVYTTDLPLEHENLSSNDISVQQEKTHSL